MATRNIRNKSTPHTSPASTSSGPSSLHQPLNPQSSRCDMVRRHQRAVSEPHSTYGEGGLDNDGCEELRSNRLNRPTRPPKRTDVGDGNQPKLQTWQATDNSDTSLDFMRRPNNVWSTEQRFALTISKLCYHLSWTDTTNIFNQLFSHELARCGFFRDGIGLQGITRGALQSQFAEIRDPRHSCGFEAIEALTLISRLQDLQAPYDATHHALISTARALNIQLQDPGQIVRSLLPQKPRDLSKSQMRTRRKRDGSATSDTGISVTYESDATSASPSKKARLMIPKQPKSAMALCNKENVGSTRPGDTLSLSSNYHDGTPMLLFRAYDPTTFAINSGHGFHSGLQPYGPTPNADDESLVEYAIDHLNRGELATPFISMTSSLAWVLRLAQQRTEGARIAIIEPRSLATLYHVAPLCAKVKASGRANFVYGNRRSYTGELEFWAWRQVPMVAVVADVPLEALLRSSHTMTAKLLSAITGQTSRHHTRIQTSAILRSYTKAEVAATVATIVKIFFPIERRRPYTLDLTRVILRSFDIAADISDWLSDDSISHAFESTMNAPYSPQTLRTADISDGLAEQADYRNSPLLSPNVADFEMWSPGCSPMGSPSVTSLSLRDGRSRAVSLNLPTRDCTPRTAMQPGSFFAPVTSMSIEKPPEMSTTIASPRTPCRGREHATGSLLTPPQTISRWRLEATPPSLAVTEKGLRPLIHIPRIALVEETTMYRGKEGRHVDHENSSGMIKHIEVSATRSSVLDGIPAIDLTDDCDSEADTIRNDPGNASLESSTVHDNGSEHERSSLLSDFKAGKRECGPTAQLLRVESTADDRARHPTMHPNFWTNPYAGGRT